MLKLIKNKSIMVQQQQMNNHLFIIPFSAAASPTLKVLKLQRSHATTGEASKLPIQAEIK